METNNPSEIGSKLRIKKFRIKPRVPSARRWLKQLVPDLTVTAEIEETLSSQADIFTKALVPVAFYQTWLREEMPAVFHALVENPEFEKAISVSALVATIGSEPEEKIGEALLRGATLESHMLSALSEESADVAMQFLVRLLNEDAEQDDCEISELVLITDPTVIMEILPQMGAADEGISLDQQNHITPRFTRVGFAAWIPPVKKEEETTIIEISIASSESE